MPFTMKRYIILIAAVLVTAVSCTTPRYISNLPQLQDEWVGRSHAEIVREFGAPTREVSDGADGQILVYEIFYTTHSTDEFMGDFTTTVEEHRDYKEFYLDPDGTCYHVRSNEIVPQGRVLNFFATGWGIVSIAIIMAGLSMAL